MQEIRQRADLFLLDIDSETRQLWKEKFTNDSVSLFEWPKFL